jgi:hypothetical protein
MDTGERDRREEQRLRQQRREVIIVSDPPPGRSHAHFQAQVKASPTQYVALPHVWHCKTCERSKVWCYLLRTARYPNGNAGAPCVCCETKACSLIKGKADDERLRFQAWLDKDSELGSSPTTSHGTSTAFQGDVLPGLQTEQASPTTPLVDRSAKIRIKVPLLPSQSASPNHVHDSTLGTGTSLPSMTSPQQAPRPSSALAGVATNEGAATTKRSWSETDTLFSDDQPDAPPAKFSRSTKASIAPPCSSDIKLSSDPKFHRYMLALSTQHEAVMEDLAKSLSADRISEKEIRRLNSIAATAQVEQERSEMQNRVLVKERDVAIGSLARFKDRDKELETQNAQLKTDSDRFKEQSQLLRIQLEQFEEKWKKSEEEKDAAVVERDDAQLVITGLKTQLDDLPKVLKQHDAAIKNAENASKERIEAQDALTTSLAENKRLVEEMKTMTEKHELEEVELEEYKTGFRRPQVVSEELQTAKASLATLQAAHQQLVADNSALSSVREDIERMREKLNIARQLADDRLEERKEMELELGQAKHEAKELAKKSKSQDDKAKERRRNWTLVKGELAGLYEKYRALEARLQNQGEGVASGSRNSMK